MLEIKKAGVLGVGIMGNGIVQILAQCGFEVIAIDTNQKALDSGLKAIGKSLARMKKKGKISEKQENLIFSNIKGTLDLRNALNDVDLVIEAIPENLELKQQAFKQLDEICPSHTILATNTSTISITAIAAVTGRPDKVIGMHFATPVPVMKGVEIIKGLDTSEETLRTAKKIVSMMGKKILYRTR